MDNHWRRLLWLGQESFYVSFREKTELESEWGQSNKKGKNDARTIYFNDMFAKNGHVCARAGSTCRWCVVVVGDLAGVVSCSVNLHHLEIILIVLLLILTWLSTCVITPSDLAKLARP
jgi:uncharacterized membrane protein